MVIGSCTIALHLPAVHSLKEKRQIIKPLLARIRKEFNVAVAEVGNMDEWQRLTIGIACVSTSRRYAHGQLEAVVHFVEQHRPDLPLIDYEIEML